MNYQLYNLEKNIKKVGKKLENIVFYLPRTLYKKNTSFKNFVTKVGSNSYKRNKKRQLAKDIFYYLDKNGKCEILGKYAFIDDYYFDIVNYNIDLLLEDKKWVKRNKLEIAETTFYEYIKENDPNCLFKVTDSQKELRVYIITR